MPDVLVTRSVELSGVPAVDRHVGAGTVDITSGRLTVFNAENRIVAGYADGHWASYRIARDPAPS